ncbi:MAG: small multi-drug export protein [Methanobacteriota archaeon]
MTTAGLWWRLGAPFALGLAYVAVLPLIFGARWTRMLGFMGLYMIPPFGKESVIPLAIADLQSAAHPFVIAFFIAAVDVVGGLFFALNFDLLAATPKVGPLVARAMRRGEAELVHRPWVRRFAFTGVFLLDMVPFKGAHAVGGTVVGRLLGLGPWKTWLAVAGGSTAGAIVMATAGAGLILAFQEDWRLGAATLAVLVAGLALFYFKVWRVSTGDRKA